MLLEIIIALLIMVILLQMIIISAISERCKESKRELKKMKNSNASKKHGKQCASAIVDRSN